MPLRLPARDSAAWYAWRLFETGLAVKLSREEGGAQRRARTVQPLLRAVGRRFGAKPRKNFVDDQAASPSSWKTPRMAVWMAAEWRSIGFGLCGPRLGRSG